MKKLFEFDPLLCPKCHGQMKIKGFVTDTRQILRLTNNLNIPDQRAPPYLRFAYPTAV